MARAVVPRAAPTAVNSVQRLGTTHAATTAGRAATSTAATIAGSEVREARHVELQPCVQGRFRQAWLSCRRPILELESLWGTPLWNHGDGSGDTYFGAARSGRHGNRVSRRGSLHPAHGGGEAPPHGRRASPSADAHCARAVQREAEAAGRIDHPSVIRVFDVGEDETSGEMYLVMGTCPARALERLLDEGGLSRARCAAHRSDRIGIDAAHAQGIVHRDIKPSTSCSRTMAPRRSSISASPASARRS